MRSRIASSLLATLAACSGDGASHDAGAGASNDAGARGDAALDATAAQPADAGRDSGHDAARDAGGDAVVITTDLPPAFKGYELYAWDEQGDVAYTLITGTNRQKTPEEIQHPDAHVSAEFIAIHGRGLDSLEQLLAHVPAGTDVIFGQLAGLPALSAEHRAAIVALLSP